MVVWGYSTPTILYYEVIGFIVVCDLSFRLVWIHIHITFATAFVVEALWVYGVVWFRNCIPQHLGL